MSNAETHDERLVKIESLLMQLQHDVEQLNKALLNQQAEIDLVRRGLDRIADSLEDNTAELRLPDEEPPPHY